MGHQRLWYWNFSANDGTVVNHERGNETQFDDDSWCLWKALDDQEGCMCLVP